MKKKRLLAFILCAALAIALIGGVSASAAKPTASGVYDLNIVADSGYTAVAVTPLTETGTTISGASADMDGDGSNDVTDGFYADAVKFQVSFTGTANTNYMIYLLAGKDATTPTETNLAYLNLYSSTSTTVTTGATGTGSAPLYPASLASGVEYSIWIAGGAACKKVASFKAYSPFTPGDVNNDEAIDILDAMIVLNHIATNITLTTDYELSDGQVYDAYDAANVIKDGAVDILDAMQILNYIATNITTFE